MTILCGVTLPAASTTNLSRGHELALSNRVPLAGHLLLQLYIRAVGMVVRDHDFRAQTILDGDDWRRCSEHTRFCPAPVSPYLRCRGCLTSALGEAVVDGTE